MAMFKMKVDEHYDEHANPTPDTLRPEQRTVPASIWFVIVVLGSLAMFAAGLVFAIATAR